MRKICIQSQGQITILDLLLLLLYLFMGVILMTRPGKTSSGSWIWGFRSTINGSPHLSLIVWSVSPSPTTYISSHGLSRRLFPLTASDWSSPTVVLSLIDPNSIIANNTMAQYHDAESALVFVAAEENMLCVVWIRKQMGYVYMDKKKEPQSIYRCNTVWHVVLVEVLGCCCVSKVSLPFALGVSWVQRHEF